MWKWFVNLVVCGVLLWGAAIAQAGEASVPNSTSSTMEWQMMPGESLNSLATLFYPDNRRMQQHFVAAAIKLNRAQMPNLSPTQRFEEQTTLQIPSLIDLSRQAAKPRKRKAVAPKPAVIEQPAAVESVAPPAAAPMSKAKAAELQSLEKRVEQRQTELDKLNQRLQSLEQDTQTLQQSIKANSKPIEEAQGRRLKRVEP